jgi:hypothetical protein
MSQSLLLDRTLWDLTLDALGNLAITSTPYATAQDAACACRTFAGEVYYDTTLGVQYFGQMLGLTPPIQFLKSQLVAAAMSAPNAASAAVYISSIEGRKVSGQVQVTDINGVTTTAGF